MVGEDAGGADPAGEVGFIMLLSPFMMVGAALVSPFMMAGAALAMRGAAAIMGRKKQSSAGAALPDEALDSPSFDGSSFDPAPFDSASFEPSPFDSSSFDL